MSVLFRLVIFIVKLPFSLLLGGLFTLMNSVLSPVRIGLKIAQLVLLVAIVVVVLIVVFVVN